MVASSEIGFVAGGASSDDDIIGVHTRDPIDLINGMDPWDQKKGHPSHGQGTSLRTTAKVLVRLAEGSCYGIMIAQVPVKITMSLYDLSGTTPSSK